MAELTMIEREAPEPGESRAALVKRWQDDVICARKHWKKDFDRMRRNMQFSSGKQWPGQSDQDDRYMLNLVQRVIKTTVASLYGKNPTPVAQRRRRMDFTLWDGRPESAMAAIQAMQAASAGGYVDQATGAVAPPPDPALVMQAQALVADIIQGIQRREMIDKVGETLICLLEYFISDSRPSFKGQLKRVVRRTRTTGVGYVKLGFRRAMELSEDQQKTLNEYAEKLATIGVLQADLADGQADPYSAEAEEMRLAIAAIQSQPEVIVDEGLVFSYPHSTRVIPSIGTEALMEWVGADWVAEEIMMTPDRVKKVYGKDLGSTYSAYKLDGGTPESGSYSRAKKGRAGLACIWHIYDRSTGLEYVVAEGYPDFLKEPAAPQVFVEQFIPIFALTFNEDEDEAELFPKSDVELMKHAQMEYNRANEARRQHRIAARPLYLAPKGVLEEDEVKSLANHAPHDVIEVNALDKGAKAEDLIMPVKKLGVDPNLYETETTFNDVQRVTGNQESILGGVSSGTATAQNLAESGRQGTLQLDGDNLDDMLTLLFRSAGQIMLGEMSDVTVKEIVGPGAVWPQLSRQQIASEMWLEVKAGSSGRPDQAREAANFERIAPLLLQVPGIKPEWLAERAVRIADDSTDLVDAFEAGLPSILTQNRTAQMATGDPASDPNEQGEEGGDKTAKPKNDGQDTNSYPGPGAGVQ